MLSLNQGIGEIPHTNISAYKLLFCIETGIREFIIEKLTEIEGPRWYRQRLPGDILQKYKRAMEIERSIPWTHLIPHHPIYYVDFTDLKKIIEANNNWKVLEDTFKRKEVITTTLTKLEVVRNKIAHSRKLSENDLLQVKVSYTEISEMIGKEKFHALQKNCSEQIDIGNALLKLYEFIKNAKHRILHYLPTEVSLIESASLHSWWFDETYLGHNLGPINDFIKCLESYITLPRFVGSGYIIEAWVLSNDIEIIATSAENALNLLLREWGAKDGFK